MRNEQFLICSQPHYKGSLARFAARELDPLSDVLGPDDGSALQTREEPG
jgi:hypothetical protein